MMRIVILWVLCLMIVSCNSKKHEPVIMIDEIEISMQEVDGIINEQLFHMLEGIYILRKQAAEEYVNQFVIAEEAKKRDISVAELLDREVMHLISDSLVSKRISELNGFVPDRSDYKRIYDCNTAFGREYLRESMILEAKQLYAMKLRDNHNIKITLKAPDKFRPKANLGGIEFHYKGNLKSKVEIILIGNYECEGCYQAKAIFDNLFLKYKENLKFGFCFYDSYPSLASIAVEAAAVQNNFWSMHEKIFSKHQSIDMVEALDFASQLNLDLQEFESELNSVLVKQKLQDNIKIVSDNKIATTPTMIINGNIFNAPFSQKEIEVFLEKILNK